MRRLYVILLFVFLVLGCHDKIGEEEGKPAWLSIEFLTDKSVETRAGDEMLYNLKIEKLDGTPVCSFEDCSTISERILLHAGIYRLVLKPVLMYLFIRRSRKLICREERINRLLLLAVRPM